MFCVTTTLHPHQKRAIALVFDVGGCSVPPPPTKHPPTSKTSTRCSFSTLVDVLSTSASLPPSIHTKNEQSHSFSVLVVTGCSVPPPPTTNNENKHTLLVFNVGGCSASLPPSMTQQAGKREGVEPFPVFVDFDVNWTPSRLPTDPNARRTQRTACFCVQSHRIPFVNIFILLIYT